MNKTAKFFIATTLWLSPVGAAYATAGREDNSPLVVWTFLGFCALIVVAQLLPAVRSARRAAAERRRLATEQPVKVPVED